MENNFLNTESITTEQQSKENWSKPELEVLSIKNETLLHSNTPSGDGSTGFS